MMGKTHKSCALVEDMTKMSIAIKGGPRKSLGGRGMFVVVVGVGLSNRHRHGGTSCQPLHDTERLQFINSIRKGPLGAHIKRVIELLFETRQAFTPEQINGSCYVIILSNKVVLIV
ncbi:hypothetical protein Bca4012_076283 [Brassica carinata]